MRSILCREEMFDKTPKRLPKKKKVVNKVAVSIIETQTTSAEKSKKKPKKHEKPSQW